MKSLFKKKKHDVPFNAVNPHEIPMKITELRSRGHLLTAGAAGVGPAVVEVAGGTWFWSSWDFITLGIYRITMDVSGMWMLMGFQEIYLS